jgi:hypothetical protein
MFSDAATFLENAEMEVSSALSSPLQLLPPSRHCPLHFNSVLLFDSLPYPLSLCFLISARVHLMCTSIDMASSEIAVAVVGMNEIESKSPHCWMPKNILVDAEPSHPPIDIIPSLKDDTDPMSSLIATGSRSRQEFPASIYPPNWDDRSIIELAVKQAAAAANTILVNAGTHKQLANPTTILTCKMHRSYRPPPKANRADGKSKPRQTATGKPPPNQVCPFKIVLVLDPGNCWYLKHWSGNCHHKFHRELQAGEERRPMDNHGSKRRKDLEDETMTEQQKFPLAWNQSSDLFETCTSAISCVCSQAEMSSNKAVEAIVRSHMASMIEEVQTELHKTQVEPQRCVRKKNSSEPNRTRRNNKDTERQHARFGAGSLVTRPI